MTWQTVKYVGRGGAHFNERALDQVRVSVTKSKASPSPVVNFLIGKNVLDKMGWKLGDQFEISVDVRSKLFWVRPAAVGYKLTANTHSGKTKTAVVCSISFTAAERYKNHIPFIGDAHSAQAMRYSIAPEGGIIVVYDRVQGGFR